MLAQWLHSIDQSVFYHGLVGFFCLYPTIAAIMWMTTTQFFRSRWERHTDRDALPEPQGTLPRVSILIPAHNEARVIIHALDAIRRIDYPDFEVVVIDDGSTDSTSDAVATYLKDPRVRLIRKHCNQGKALALNDALLCVTGDILVCIDADAAPEPDLLRKLVPHFSLPRTAAVTGNPRVANVDTFLARLQLIEFSAIISLLRRSQRIWGRIQTVSGVVCALRKSALIDVGGFSPDMATEDIELTWKLQKRFWDVRYEPRAIVWMTVPTSYRGLLRQRRRWARGLAEVMHRHRDVMMHWKYRRMWPIFIESTLSILWSSCFVALALLWLVAYASGHPLSGTHPMINLWSMTIATLCIAQLCWGMKVDTPYDPHMSRYAPYVVFYPLIYWSLMALCTVLALPSLITDPHRQPVRWSTTRPGEGPDA